MNYHFINSNLNPEVSGLSAGGYQGYVRKNIFQGQQWLDEFFYGNNSGFRRGNFPEKDFKLDGIPLDKKAKLNDFISVAALLNGLIVNDKVKAVLQTCQLPPHKYYAVTFDQAGTKIEGYYWLYYNLLDGSKHINYQKTFFDTIDEEKVLGHKVTIQKYEDYIHYTKVMEKGIHVEKIVFDQTFDLGIDLFGMRFWGGRNYISDRLKQKLEENEIIGYELRKPIDPVIEWEV